MFVTTSISIAGMEDYDDYMSIQAALAVMMALSINRNDGRWLEDTGLIGSLKGLESGRWRPYVAGEDHGWSEHCLMTRINLGVVSSTWLEGTSGVMEDAFVFAGGCPDANVAGVGEVVDRCNVQMLKDMFHAVTGLRTDEDRCSPMHGNERPSAVDEIPVEGKEELCWYGDCPIMDGTGCGTGMCDHLTGVLPVIGVPLPVLGENACLHPECAEDGERECEDRGVV